MFKKSTHTNYITFLRASGVAKGKKSLFIYFNKRIRVCDVATVIAVALFSNQIKFDRWHLMSIDSNVGLLRYRCENLRNGIVVHSTDFEVILCRGFVSIG